MELFIEVQSITVRRQGSTILEKASARVPLGKTMFILGPSGSGKSTLLKAMAGITFPDEGAVLVMGKDYRDMTELEDKMFRHSAAFVFQDGALWANQSVYNNLYIPLRHHQPNITLQEAKRRIQESLERVHFTDSPDSRPATLSKGEQKLVAFARALVIQPQVLFMDEPTSFIDEAGVRNLDKILKEMSDEGKTIVAVGNKYDLAFRIADYLCIVNKGGVYAVGPTLEVIEQWPDFLEPLTPRHHKLLEAHRIKDGYNQ